MSNRQVPLMLSVPQECRDKLRRMAAKRNLQNPNKVTGAATIARELVLEGIERVEQMEANLQPPDALPENSGLLVEPEKSIRNSKNEKETEKCQTGVRVT